jgi:hypothetical protein
MPSVPEGGSEPTRASRFFSFPVARTTFSVPPFTTASPAES